VKRFTVTCSQPVENQLAELILKHWGKPLADQLTASANQIDVELSLRPLEIGTQITANVRLLVGSPLAVEYAVYEDDCTVVLLSYRRTL
jgi:ABC-type uncharacterized transport system permease subunit